VGGGRGQRISLSRHYSTGSAAGNPS